MTDATDRWLDQWPKYCTKCGGWGQITYEDNHGIPGPTERIVDNCSCVDSNICPRCGIQEAFPVDGETVCRGCAWDADDPDGCPGDPRDDGYEEPWEDDEVPY